MVQTETDRRMGLNLNLSMYSLPKPLSQFLDEVSRIKDNHSKLFEIDGYVGKLEEERKKIDVFKRELPYCMLLITEAIGALKEEALKGVSNGKFDVGEGAKLGTENKKNWMSSAQLWISNPNSRRRWSQDLHRKFVDALHRLGGSQVATPKQIRELMQIDGLTNDEVKSHLQKYRMHIRKHPPHLASDQPGLLDRESQSLISLSRSDSPQSPLVERGSWKSESKKKRQGLDLEL
ncbi:unnamed protein product [Arabis nemorensis]|uniref:HTH myb-type domain-containing protein n=1 Tax=Arabis nemorensis TaxID=586526 RepID=A0A565C8I9_9BRAS|nr:unnamed protein product [Arabis nemorensis]